MNTVAVKVRRKSPFRSAAPVLDWETDLRQAKFLANLLDSQFEVGGIRFGLDAIVGLIPVLGDTLAALAGVYPIHLARKHQLGKAVELKMWGNLAIDYFGGLVPVVGDAFDVAFKANLKNVALLEEAATKRPDDREVR